MDVPKDGSGPATRVPKNVGKARGMAVSGSAGVIAGSETLTIEADRGAIVAASEGLPARSRPRIATGFTTGWSSVTSSGTAAITN
jgi:hypothetical protein